MENELIRIYLAKEIQLRMFREAENERLIRLSRTTRGSQPINFQRLLIWVMKVRKKLGTRLENPQTSDILSS